MTMTCEHCGKEVTGQYCHACSKAATKQVMSGRKKLGLCLIIGPWIGLVLLMSAYAVVTFVTSAIVSGTAQAMFVETAHAEPLAAEDFLSDSTGFGVDDEQYDYDRPGYATGTPDSDADMREAVGSLIGVLLGFLGILCILGIFVGTPVGIYLLVTDGKKKE